MSETFHFKSAGSILIPLSDGAEAFTDDMPEKYDNGIVFLAFTDSSGSPVKVTGTGFARAYGDPGLGVYHADEAGIEVYAADIDPTLDGVEVPMPGFPSKMLKGKVVFTGDFTPATHALAICVRQGERHEL